jgi:hypothetical protein
MALRFVRRSLVVGIAILSAGAAATMAAPGAFAYGSADRPVAQVEISGNCDNPSFPLCAPEPDGVGTGGVWAWSELDADGSMDATVAFCGHTVGGGGAGGGGGPVRSGHWWIISSLADAPAGAGPFFDPSKYHGSLYVLDFFPGSGADDFIAVVPTSVGHYSLHPAPAVSIQTQVAP